MNASKIAEWYGSLYENADPRIRDKFLMGQPHWLILSYVFYVILTTVILPRFMQGRKPYDFQRISLYIDGLLLSISFFFFVICAFAWMFLYNWFCQAMDPTNAWDARISVELCYLYLLTRYIYTLHSLPFVLSKRKSSLANYLLVHHALFPIIVWWIINFYPGGHVTFGGFINSMTHVCLFGIKFVILYYPEVKKWRRIFHVYIHVFQFTSIFLHSVQMYVWNDCGVPMSIVNTEVIGALVIAAFYYIFVVHKKDSTDILNLNKVNSMETAKMNV